MSNYPPGVKSSDFDAPSWEYKSIYLEVDDFMHDTGYGEYSGYLTVDIQRLTDGSIEIGDGVFVPVGNNGQELPEITINRFTTEQENLIQEKANEYFETRGE
jgi:hypothetical protein